jgi:RHS repeat-associated protein
MNIVQTVVRVFLVGCALAAGWVQAGTVTYYHNDVAGSPIVATNAAGQVIWRESYRPYGERLTNAPASSTNDIWFTSRRQDVDTGLLYMGARYYDPVIGRFLSMDPVGFDEKNIHSFNRYAYANNNPYRFKDSDGRAPTPIDAGFLLYDTAKLVHAIATNGDVRAAAIDVGISAGAILIPLPGAALAIKAERSVEAARAAERAIEGTGVARAAPDFIVSPGGTAFPVPKGAEGPVSVVNSTGKETGTAFINGAGGANGQVETMRVMGPTPARGNAPAYPNGYVKYENVSGQGVNPYTGRTGSKAETHFPLD